MSDQDDVRRIALALPETREAEDHFSFSVANKGKQKGFVWAWNERVEPKKPRVARPGVVAVRVVDRFDNEALLASDEKTFFTEPHYRRVDARIENLAEAKSPFRPSSSRRSSIRRAAAAHLHPA